MKIMQFSHCINRPVALACFALLNNLLFKPCIAAPVIDNAVGLWHFPRQLGVTTLYTFVDGSQPENIRVRASGQLLVTVSTTPVLYQINPFSQQTGSPIHTFSGYTSLFGIVESAAYTDVFYVIAGNFTGSPDFFGIAGTWSLFEVDLRSSSTSVNKVLDFPKNVQLLDGFAVVNSQYLITGDAQTGTLYRIDLLQKTAKAVLQSALLDGTTDDPAASLAHVGINGIKVHDSNVYFTNSALGTFGRIPLNMNTALPTGNPVVLENYGTVTDDFNFDGDGNQFISEPFNGIVLRPADTTPQNNHTRLLAPLFGANSNAFGRTFLDKCILYSTFDGSPSGIASVNTNGQFCG